MKRAMMKMTLIFAGVLLAGICPRMARAQAETTPDTYKTPEAAPMPAPVAKVEFQGKFSLPYKARCNGHNLTPGEYTLAVKTLGGKRIVTIAREGNEVELTVSKVSNDAPTEQSAVMLRHGPGPWARTVEAVYVENLKIRLYLDESGHSNPLDKLFGDLKKLPVN